MQCLYRVFQVNRFSEKIISVKQLIHHFDIRTYRYLKHPVLF